MVFFIAMMGIHHLSFFLTLHMLMAAPFKFDAPSPDDLVSNGLQSRKLKSKGISIFQMDCITGLYFH